MQRQGSFAEAEYAGKKKQTRRDKFLAEMEQAVPWSRLVTRLAPLYPKGECGRPPIALERMLRVYFVQQWYGLSDEAVEDAFYDSLALRGFAGIALSRDPVPDATTVLHFRHWLERHDLTKGLFEEVNAMLEERGVLLRQGTIVDATIIAAPSSTKNKQQSRDPEMHQTKKGNQWYFGMKAHIGVDVASGLVHTVVGTAANEADVTQTAALLYHTSHTRLLQRIPKSSRVANSCGNSGSGDRADAGNGRQALARRIRPMPFDQLPLQSEHADSNRIDVADQGEKHRFRQLGHDSGVGCRNQGTQFRKALNTLGNYETELGGMGANGIRHHCTLADEKLSRAMQHQRCLLIRLLDRHETHVGPLYRLADRLGVGSVVFIGFDIGAHVLGRHQLNIMAEAPQLACPMVPAAAGLERVSEEVAIGQAARGGSFAGSASISAGVSSVIPSICI